MAEKAKIKYKSVFKSHQQLTKNYSTTYVCKKECTGEGGSSLHHPVLSYIKSSEYGN